MKLTLAALLLLVLHVHANTKAQSVTLSVERMPLEKVCKEIERQTGYHFFYSQDLNVASVLVTVTLNSVDLETAVKRVFSGVPCSFNIIDKVIVIKSNRQVESKENVNDPEIDVKGVVYTEQGQPLAGASVYVKGEKKSTTTNSTGEFLLKGVTKGSILVVTFVGYSAKEVPAAAATNLRVILDVAANPLDAAVVKGYYVTSNRLNTGDVTTVKGEDIQKQPVSDPILALEGRVPGLYIQQSSGVPGAYSKISLRGRNSIANGIDPFYIVDGIPFTNASLTSSYIGGGAAGTPSNRQGSASYNTGAGLSPFNNLNPADIESIVVLKDADATAIYGSRGANGVVLITTKKGKAGQTAVDADLSYGQARVSNKIKLLNTQQYLQMRREAFHNDDAVPDAYADFDITFWDTTKYTDWQKVLVGNAASFLRGQVNINGGNSTTQYFLGIGSTSQGTVFPGNYKDEKTTVNLNVNNSGFEQKLKTQLSVSYTYDFNRIPTADLTQYITLAPNAPSVYDKNGALNWAILDGASTWNNPLANTKNQARSISNSLISHLDLIGTILPGLQIKGSFGYTLTQMGQYNTTLASSYAPPYDNLSSLRQALFADASIKTWIIEPQISYNRRLGSGVLDVLLGGTLQENMSKSIGQVASNFSSDALVYNPVAATSLRAVNYYLNQYNYSAQYARVGYVLNDRYLINLTGRRDGSSRFGPGKQFGNFGAIGAGWIFGDEPFIKNTIHWLSFGKLRGSWGVTGNDQLPDYKFLDTYTPNSSTYQGVSGLYPTQLTNPYYAWEKVRKIEGGIDLGFIKDRISLSVGYYDNKTNNQLVGYPLPYVTGFTSVQFNLPAVISNSGLELAITTTNLQGNNLKWTSSFNISFPRNKLVSYPGIENSSYASLYKVGQPLSVLYRYHYTGVDPQTGLYSFSTKNGAGTLDFRSDNYFTRPVTQRYFGGFENRFSYKGFECSFMLQFVKQLGINTTFIQMPGIFNVNRLTDELSRWQQPGERVSAMKFTESGQNSGSLNNYFNSDAVICDASFIRLKNVAFSYQISKRAIQKVNLRNAKIYIQTQNIFTLTKYRGIDPEASSGNFTLPPLRNIVLGLQISL